MNFQDISLEIKDRVHPFLYRYGEGSCQHSFAASFCMREKYGDRFCVEDGFLFTLRSRRCTEDERVYLFPLGDPGDEDGACRAVEKVLEDAHAHGLRARFETVTERAADLLRRRFGKRFDLREERDLAEYLYTFEKLSELPGHEMASKRYDLHTFERNYSGRYRVCAIETGEQLAEIARFQDVWMEQKLDHEEDVQLELEHEAIRIGLENFFALALTGILVYIDGALAGYAYGTPLSETCYDVMIEKGNREIPDIYRVLNRDLVRVCCKGRALINREEDLGVEGLRKAKLSYKPDILLKKFVVREKEDR